MTLHHLDGATILRYASGDLDVAFSIVVASHLAMCETCRRAVRDAEALGGELLATREESPLSHGAFARLMQQVDSRDRTIRVAKPDGTANTSPVPAPLRRHIGGDLDRVPWKTIAPGVSKCHVELQSQGPSSLFLLKVDPGKTVPEHGHGGNELTLVLLGAYRDELGLFARGDISDLDEHVEHHPQVEPEEPCICVVASEAPLRFKGMISRLLQPFFRM